MHVDTRAEDMKFATNGKGKRYGLGHVAARIERCKQQLLELRREKVLLEGRMKKVTNPVEQRMILLRIHEIDERLRDQVPNVNAAAGHYNQQLPRHLRI